MRRYRNTKIVATLGPSSRTKRQIRSMIKAGVDVFRLNFSHGSHEDHRSRFNAIRQLEKELDWPVAIMADLQGPKLRIGVFENDEIELNVGSSFVLDLEEAAGSGRRVQLPHQEIFDAAVVGMDLLLDDGKIRLRVQNATESSIETKVITGGTLSNRKGVNVPGVTLGLSSLSEKDREDLEFALSLGFDWIALSFVQRPKDVAEARELINGRASVLIKLEKPAAIEHLDELVKMSDAVMVARGDLGVELPPEKVPGIQKRIVKLCRHWGKPVVVATQMLDSMINTSSPTRAEASDVANAVFDGTSAVMLSGETAIGSYPVESVETMARIAERADQSFDFGRWAERVAELRQSSDAESGNGGSQGITDAMTMATWRAANELDLAALLCISGSGFTVRSMARFRPNVPILGMTMDERTAQQLTLSWGVTPFCIEAAMGYEERIGNAIATAKSEGILQSNDLIGVLAGITGDSPATDVLRIMRVV